MFPTHSTEAPIADSEGRPFTFLVSTTAASRDIRGNMGNADYSYAFVLKGLAPALAELGHWRTISHPESSLAYQADQAKAQGDFAVHLSIQPPQNGYLTPALPNVLFPFWEFPEIPDRDFGFDTRQNWKRITGRADLILTACQFTAEAFRRSGVACPVEVVPVPMAPEVFDVPPWDPEQRWTIPCRHTVWEGPSEPSSATSSTPATAPKWKRVLKRVYGRLHGIYKRHVLRWISLEAAEILFQTKNKLMRKANAGPTLLPSTPLTLSGLVYTSIFNMGDRRKNIDDLLSGFLLAFRDRPDVTLVLKLATNPERERHELKELRHRYDRLNLEHACRVVVITDYLTDAQMNEMMRATTYYLNTSKAEGACLPLQQALAAGRPALAPRHTAMLDYIDDEVAFVLRSHAEPTFFPHDPEPSFETSWHRLVWIDIRDRLLESAEVAERDRPRYDVLAAAARHRMNDLYSRPAVVKALRRALDRLPESALKRDFSWSA
ncbi:glycosyltransferase [soil metagenome]